MGAYANLTFGEFAMGEWKSYIPLEPMLLFTQGDYVYKRITGEEYDDARHKFVTTAEVAKKRIDSRGLTLAACRRLFDEFRTSEFWDFNASTGKDSFTPNTITFDEYLKACATVYKKYDNWYIFAQSDKVKNRKLQRIFGERFFDTEQYFDDAAMCIVIRAFLEIIPPDTSVVLDVSELIDPDATEEDMADLYHEHMQIMFRRIGLNYQLYGFVLQDDPNVDKRLRERIESLSEDLFIQHVLVPLIDKMGFERVQQVTYHGRNEFGSDIRPFRYTTPLGTLEYYALQAKAVQIHGTSATTGNAGELISQMTQAFSVSFVDDLDNERKKLDKFIIATSKSITPDARHVIEEAVTGNRTVVFMDLDKTVALLKQYGLAQYVLFTEFD